MLKIKADKMCELEKMGFENGIINNTIFEIDDKAGNYGCLVVSLADRTIEMFANYCNTYIGDKILEKFYDLIKADMVEVCDD